MMNEKHLNRRRFERFTVPPMYTTVRVHHPTDDVCWDGHAYDISEGGLRIELDERLGDDERVRVELRLPGAATAEEPRVLRLDCEVVRSNDDDDDPGPVRMGLRLIDFVDPDGHGRLIRYLGTGMLRRAA